MSYNLSKSTTENGTYSEIPVKGNNITSLVPVSKTASTKVLADDIEVPVGVTYYELKVTLNYLPDVNQDSDLEAKFYSWFKLEDIKHQDQVPLLEAILTKSNKEDVDDYNASDVDKGEVFVFDHEATGQVNSWSKEDLRDYRYIGNIPNNYIEFNDETWRIIGVFTVEVKEADNSIEKKQLVKIIKDTLIGRNPWNYATIGESYVGNKWENGTLHTLLNNSYLNTGNPFTFTHGSDPYYVATIEKGLGTIARTQIAYVKYFLGGTSTFDNSGPDFYNFERGTMTCANGCTAGFDCCSGQTRETDVIQKVGLMYPSDYLYTYANKVDDVCYENGSHCTTGYNGTPSNGWLFKSDTVQWTQTPFGNHRFNIYIANNNGNMITTSVAELVYLTPDIEVLGSGAEDDHYIIQSN